MNYILSFILCMAIHLKAADSYSIENPLNATSSYSTLID